MVSIALQYAVQYQCGEQSAAIFTCDMQMSGFEIYNNTFIDCQKGTFVGGGRRNHVYNNYYEDCDDAVHLDARGLNWQKAMCQKVWINAWRMHRSNSVLHLSLVICSLGQFSC